MGIANRSTPANSCHLTNPYPLWLGCTFGEIASVYGAIILAASIIFGVVALSIGHGTLMIIGVFATVLIVPRLLIQRLGQLKALRPPGFLRVSCRLWLSRMTMGLITHPFIHRTGQWLTGRSLSPTHRGVR